MASTKVDWGAFADDADKLVAKVIVLVSWLLLMPT